MVSSGIIMGLWTVQPATHLIAIGSESMTTLPQSLTAAQLLRSMIESHNSDECLLWPMHRDRDGYGRLEFQGKKRGAHRVAFFFTYGYWPTNALHSCDNPTCFNPRHLSDGSTLLNQNQKAQRGRSIRGERQHDAKLTEQSVIEARNEYALGKDGYHVLAKKYGVTKVAMRWAITGKTWPHIPGAVESITERPSRTHCSKGHELTPDTAYIYPNGKRYCKACTAERGKRRIR